MRIRPGIIGAICAAVVIASVSMRPWTDSSSARTRCDPGRAQVVIGDRGLAGERAAPAVDPSALGHVERRVREEFDRLRPLGLPGALVALDVPGNVVLRVELGQADASTGGPLTRHHEMRVGSIAKPFVGTIFLQLAAERGIDPDTPVSRYLDGVPGGEAITLRMLGNHTSGLFDSIADPSFRAGINAEPERVWSRAEILHAAFAHEPVCPPGRSFSYANTNTILLAEISERISGQTLPDLIRQRILQPLGMNHTRVSGPTPVPRPGARGYRHGRAADRVEYGRVFFDATRFSASWSDAAGDMNSTLDDLLKAVRPLATGQLLGESGRAELHRFIVASDEFHYAFTLMDYAGLIGHAGDVPGFSGFMGWMPESDAAVVVLTNLSNLADGSSPAIRLAITARDALGAAPSRADGEDPVEAGEGE